MTNYSIIENLSVEQIVELYDDLIEFDKTQLSWCVCCNDTNCSGNYSAWLLIKGDQGVNGCMSIHYHCNNSNPWASCPVAYYICRSYGNDCPSLSQTLGYTTCF